MADFRARQRVQIHDGTDEFGVLVSKPIFVSLSDGTEAVSVNASNQLEVSVESLNDGGNSITVDDGGLTLSIDDGGSTISIDGTLTGITNDVNIADGGNTITVDANQLDIDSLNKDDDEVLVWANTAKDGTGTDYVPLVDADGHLQVDILSGTSTDTLADDAAFTIATSKVYPMGALFDDVATDTVDEGDIGAPRMTSDRVLYGKLVANDGVDIGDVDVASVPAPLSTTGGGTEAAALRVTIANDSTGLVSIDDGGGDISIDDGGNTITIDGTLTGITNDVNIADGGNSITVDALNLDIRDLLHTSDSVAIGDGVETLNITAAGEAEIDIAAQSLTALKVSKDANANSETNPIFVQTVTTAVSGEEVHDYDTQAALAKDASDTHTYTAAGTFLLKSVIVSASGAMKCEVKAGAAAAETTRAVIFTSGAKPMEQVFFDPPIEATVGQNILVVRRNDDNNAMDVYSTIIGSDI